MRSLFQILKHVVAVIFLVFLPLQVLAQHSGDMDTLFDVLKSVGPEDALEVEEKIWSEWSKSGSAAMDLLHKKGTTALDGGNFDAAIDHFTALTDHSPEFAAGWYGLARAYFESDLWGPTLDALGRTLALEPRHFAAYVGLAVFFEETEQFDRALEAANLAGAIHPHYENLSVLQDRLLKITAGESL